jgi:hypothetical protein
MGALELCESCIATISPTATETDPVVLLVAVLPAAALEALVVRLVADPFLYSVAVTVSAPADPETVYMVNVSFVKLQPTGMAPPAKAGVFVVWAESPLRLT